MIESSLMAKKSLGAPEAQKKPKRKGPAPGTGGRPRVEFDPAQAEKLAALHCTGVEIAGFFNMSYDTLCRRIGEKYSLTFTEWFERYSAAGKLSLRRKQYEVAMKDNPQMLKHLGVQWLNQTDKRETTHKAALPVGSYDQFIIDRHRKQRAVALDEPTSLNGIIEVDSKITPMEEKNVSEVQPIPSKTSKRKSDDLHRKQPNRSPRGEGQENPDSHDRAPEFGE